MECSICGIEKLANEFPPEPVTDMCRHPALFCLRCTIKKVVETSTCPHQGCNQVAKLSDPKLQWFEAILRRLFTEYDTIYTPEVLHPIFDEGILTVSLLTGESIQIVYNPNIQVHKLKQKIHAQLKHEVNKQKLLYNDTELKDYRSDGQLACLLDFGVKPNSSLYLVILLMSIPEAFDHNRQNVHIYKPFNDRPFNST